MSIDALYKQITKIKNAASGVYNVITASESFYYGIDSDANTVFISKSKNKNGRPIAQQTKHLYLGQNIACTINIGGETIKDVFDIIICFSKSPNQITTFLQLTQVYTEATKATDTNICTFFDSLKNLFTNKQQLPLSDLQGLYGELSFIKYMSEKGVNVSPYWQSQDRMKFDFSVDTDRKIEVKTTTNENRKHKFRHEQLVSDIYDIWIVSFILRKDDQGLSLYDLAEAVMTANPANLSLHTYITRLLNNYSVQELQSIKFNEQYTNNNIRFYNTINVPRFPDRQPDGVSNTEYDSDLSTVQSRPVDEIIAWLRKSKGAEHAKQNKTG